MFWDKSWVKFWPGGFFKNLARGTAFILNFLFHRYNIRKILLERDFELVAIKNLGQVFTLNLIPRERYRVIRLDF